jgi:hypothetical protein
MRENANPIAPLIPAYVKTMTSFQVRPYPHYLKNVMKVEILKNLENRTQKYNPISL